tara:strand:- start:202 stop:957 length:756 start_codon:yes stop_codon:yes gene_type:complete
MRIIARLDIKGPNLIKGINLEGLRVLGDPNKFAIKYYSEGADELIFMDLVASLYNRNSLHEIIKLACRNIFIPFTVGGGIRSVDDASKIFDSGADKVAINTAAVKNPNIIQELSKRFGSQAIVLSVEAKKKENMKWEVYIESGRESTGIDVIDWVKKGAELGAGELLLTSVDMEGTTKGFDIELLKLVSNEIKIPVIASGGFGKLDDLNLALKAGSDAVSIAHMLHYKKLRLQEIRDYALKLKLDVRKFNQ